MLPSRKDFPRRLVNEAAKAGQPAARKVLFGFGRRYAVAPVHSRFGELEWFVWDADRMDSDGHPDVVRQEPSLERALEGLDLSVPDGWEEAW